MTLSDRASIARLVLVERRDTVAPRDPRTAHVRRYRLARTQLAGRPPAGRTPAGEVASRSWART